jgi:hypothetical protein
MNLNVVVFSQGSQTGYVIGVLFDPTAPTIPIGQAYTSLPISGNGILPFYNLNNQNYIYREYLSTTTDYTQGTQIGNDYQIDAAQVASGISSPDLWVTYNSSNQLVVAGIGHPYILTLDLTGLSTGNTNNGKLYYKINNNNTDNFVYLYKNSAQTQLVASGSALIGASVSLVAQNSSGINGSITLNGQPVINDSSCIIYLPSNYTISGTLAYTIGGSGGIGFSGNSYINPALNGWVYSLEQRGVGTLQPSVDYNLISGGGWTLINGYVIQVNDSFVHHFQPQLNQNVPPANSNGNPQGSLFGVSSNPVITNNKVFASTDMGQIWIFSSTNGNITGTLPDPTTVPDGKITEFNHEGGNATMISIIPTTSIKYCGQNIAPSAPYQAFYLAQGESVSFYKIGSIWYVFKDNSNFKTVGQLFETEQLDEFNSLPLDGSLLSRTLYPRLWEYVQRLPNTVLISDSLWVYFDENNLFYPNVGCFSTGDGSTTFRLPLVMECWVSAGEGNPNTMIASGFTRAIGTPNASGAGFGSLIPSQGSSGNRTIGQNMWSKLGSFLAYLKGSLVKATSNGNDLEMIIALGVPASAINGTNPADVTTPSGGDNQTAQPIQINPLPYNQNFVEVNQETAPGNTALYKLMRY